MLCAVSDIRDTEVTKRTHSIMDLSCTRKRQDNKNSKHTYI